ncbi:hypothetical protein BURC_03237 [Burkholderiaceae bacterium]|nr:hypothetical protein BURC_03237 [Burkholderiaceae bacterium]
MRRPGLAWRFVAALLFFFAGVAVAQTDTRQFDHLKTGFALTGVHANERCESCHVNGIFKGTPRECSSCHTSGSRFARSNTVMPQRHVPTRESCANCHNTQSFAGARFSHTGVQPGTCTSCHNGQFAPGKTPEHMPTTASCDSCHRSTGWRPATGFNHAGVAPGSCATCHNGSRATGRPARHVPYQAVSGIAVAGCDSCHRNGFSSWVPARLHGAVSVSTQCATCHSGGYPPAVGKPATAIHSGQTVCENCHKTTTSWAARVDHASLTAATNCSSCHNGSAATGKSATHMPVAATNCSACHSTTAWQPTRWNHSQLVVTNQCSSCHSGAYPPADGKPPAHIPYQLVTGLVATNCDSCHKSGTTSWLPARLHSAVSVSTQCAICHSGSYPPAVGKPGTAVHVGQTVCENCHRSTSSWGSVTFAHSAANAVGTGTCDSCHNGSAAKGKPANHIPVTSGTARCDSCHRSQSSFATATTMNHSVVSTQTCKGCHNGSYLSAGNTGALAKPANHIPEAQLLNGAAMDCVACHTGTTSWGSARMNHNGSQGGGAGWCKSCHMSGTAYLGSMEKKSLTHERKTPPAIDCSESGCHRPLGSKGATYTKWD